MEELTRCKTFRATIYCGFRFGYDDFHNPDSSWGMGKAEAVCKKYCNEVGFGVTIKPTRFIYKNGFENGVEVGLINYPRIPRTDEENKSHAIKIAKLLKKEFRQIRVSVVFDDETVMVGPID